MRLVQLIHVCGVAAMLLTPSAQAADPVRFERSALFARFDRDQNGELDEREIQALRHAYGGIDVPLLPDRPFDYKTAGIPPQINVDELARTDSTPEDNPITNAGAALGRVLFYDRQLSANNSVACASCHLQRAGFSDPRRFSVGHGGGKTGRNAMSLANLRYSNLQGHRPGFFWDERAATLEDQVLMPIQDKTEMGMTLDELERRLAGLPYYPRLFTAAFGSPESTRERVARAVAQFMRSMVSMNSRFDQAAKPGQSSADDFEGFTKQENLGKSLFFNGTDGIAEHGCAHCHIPPTFGMAKSLNNGLDLQYKDPGLGALGRKPNDPFTPSNDGKFKAPSLRNVELTAPYMHDGRFKTLDEVIDHYSDRVHMHKNLGLGLEAPGEGQTTGFRFTAAQKQALLAFLKTLTDKTFVTDERFSDPFVRLAPPKSD